MSGPPPFEPSPALLCSLNASISTSISQYMSTSSPTEKAAALGRLTQSAKKLSSAATDPTHAVELFAHQPNAQACVRIAVGMGIFECLPASEPTTLLQIASATGTEPDFALRIMRALAAIGAVQQVDDDSYTHTPLSRIWAMRTTRAAFKVWDDTILTISQYPAYFAKYGFGSPSDPKNAPAAFARGEQDVDVFTLMSHQPDSLNAFNETMSMASWIAGKEICDTFRFDKLEASESGVVLVDVGGGKGQTLDDILKAYPSIKGHVVLEDLKVVLDSGTVELDERVEVRHYNFLEEVQPVIGATAYFFKWVFHDWPDAYCLTILANLAPAMRGHASKLLICDLVIPDRDPPVAKALRDINMLQYAGKERSQEQWDTLLKSGGFQIVKIYGLENRMNSVIEAVLDE